MSKKRGYQVLVSNRARDMLFKHAQFLAQVSVEAGEKLFDQFEEKVAALEEMPERIRLMDSEPERSKGLRPLIVDNYTVFFVVKAEAVYIVRVLYSASDIGKRLFEE